MKIWDTRVQREFRAAKPRLSLGVTAFSRVKRTFCHPKHGIHGSKWLHGARGACGCICDFWGSFHKPEALRTNARRVVSTRAVWGYIRGFPSELHAVR
jgi:hypothetical protein